MNQLTIAAAVLVIGLFSTACAEPLAEVAANLI
jgi:hypothetical protein